MRLGDIDADNPLSRDNFPSRDNPPSSMMENAVERSELRTVTPQFSRDGYRRLIEGFRSAGYKPATFDNVRRERRDVILRHDVDVSLEAAVDIAELEYEMGVQATYFVMVSNRFYNIFTPEARRIVTRLSELQHHVGLHFDASAYPSEDVLADYGAAVSREFRILAAVVDDPIKIVSFHNPRPELINRERPEGGLPHTYEPRFFSDLAYIADSGGGWRFGGPFERAAFKDGTAIHLLTHPIWWAHDVPTAGPEATLEKFATEHMARLQESLAQGFKAYREFLQGRRRSE